MMMMMRFRYGLSEVVYDSRWLLRVFVRGRGTTSFHDFGSCWTGGVGAASPSSVDNDSRVCCVVCRRERVRSENVASSEYVSKYKIG